MSVVYSPKLWTSTQTDTGWRLVRAGVPGVPGPKGDTGDAGAAGAPGPNLITPFTSVSNIDNNSLLANVGGFVTGVSMNAYATASAVSASMAAHVAELDPHTQYLLETDAATTYAAISHTHAASAIVSGTLADARLSSNIPLLNAANTFVNTVTISATAAAGLVINGKSGYYPLTINRDSALGGGVGVQAGPDGSLSAITFQTTGGIRVTAFGAYVGVLAYNRIEFPSTGLDTYVAAAGNSFRLHGEASQTADLFQLLLPSSTGTRRAVHGLLPGWIVATDATRRGQFTEEVYDTAARAIRRAYSDGSRGYIAQTVHATAPADADLNPSELVFYTDGSGQLKIKLKDASGTVRSGTVTLT